MRTARLNLSWQKCTGSPATWCSLTKVNLDHSHFDGLEGVYIIWHGGENPQTVRVGQGLIRDRLQAHRNDLPILAYGPLGLYVTWAPVASAQRAGVERYLAETLRPLIGERSPNVSPVPVNLPWS